MGLVCGAVVALFVRGMPELPPRCSDPPPPPPPRASLPPPLLACPRCLPVPEAWARQEREWVQHACPVGQYNDLATAWLGPAGRRGATRWRERVARV